MAQTVFEVNRNDVDASQLEFYIRKSWEVCPFAAYRREDGSIILIIDGELDEADAQTIQSAIDNYVVPPETVPESITPAELRIALRKLHGISKTQLDAVVESIFSSIPDPDDQQDARDLWQYANTIERQHPLIAVAGAAFGLSEQQIDNVFIYGSKI